MLPRALSTLTVLRVRMEKDEEDEEDRRYADTASTAPTRATFSRIYARALVVSDGSTSTAFGGGRG